MSGIDGRRLVDAAWLAEHLRDPELRVYDTAVHLRPGPPHPYRVESGREDYERAHVPGAAFLDLIQELSDRDAPFPFTAPPPAALAEAFGRAGIGDDTPVVLYSSSHPMWATRVWWMLRALGFDRAAVLDGALTGWQEAGQPVEQGSRRHPAATLTPKPRPECWVERDDLLASLPGGSDPERAAATCVVNALPRSVYTGEDGGRYGRPGHITGSVSLPYGEIVDAEKATFADLGAARAAFERAGLLGAERVVCYCGGGISATIDAFVLTLLGHDRVAVYDGSMREWASDPELPLTTGDAPGRLDAPSG